jgi:hypothetical protein
MHTRGKAFSQATLFQMESLPHPALEQIRKLDLMNMTPVQALNELAELQRRLGGPLGKVREETG